MLVGSSGHVSQADCHWNFQFESDLAMWPVRKFDWNSNFTSIHRKIFIGILCIVCKRPWPLMEVLPSRDTLCTSRYGLARQAIVAIHSHCLIDLSAPPSNGYKSAKALWAYLILLLSELFLFKKHWAMSWVRTFLEKPRSPRSTATALFLGHFIEI